MTLRFRKNKWSNSTTPPIRVQALPNTLLTVANLSEASSSLWYINMLVLTCLTESSHTDDAVDVLRELRSVATIASRCFLFSQRSRIRRKTSPAELHSLTVACRRVLLVEGVQTKSYVPPAMLPTCRPAQLAMARAVRVNTFGLPSTLQIGRLFKLGRGENNTS